MIFGGKKCHAFEDITVTATDKHQLLKTNETPLSKLNIIVTSYFTVI